LRVVGVDQLEADLAAGRIACPDYGGPLARWWFGRERPVRMLRAVPPPRPRRAVCHPCAKTHALLPAWSVPRRRDGTEAIIAALLDAAAGQGHRMIAARLGRPPGTVRGWLRRARRRAAAIHQHASAELYELEPPDFGLDPRVVETGSPLGPRGAGSPPRRGRRSLREVSASPVKTAKTTDEGSRLGGVGESARPRPKRDDVLAGSS
jgi:hypothetical protein